MKIIYTYTDEAPALATHSLLPIIQAYGDKAGVGVETRDISLAARILAAFGLHDDHLAELGELARTPDANIIKLPNISASIPQLKAAIKELQAAGHAVPDFPENPSTDEENKARAAYDAVKGSAVNPVLREGNSDRRAPASVKSYARKHPHSMGPWSKDSTSHVATMTDGDFRHSETSVTVEAPTTLTIQHVTADGTTDLRSFPVLAGEIVDAAVMRKAALQQFLAEQVADAKAKGVLFSVHLKATMMKVSDPIIFGHAVRAYFADVFATYAEDLASVGADPNQGLGGVLADLEKLPADRRAEIEAAITAAYDSGPALAQVDSSRGITNLHVPSDVIIDASMPAAIRSSGQMWNAAGEQQDTKFVIPDSSYAALYDETVKHCREHGAFDPTTMGSVPNVGLMAQKAEEYGSHDKTFEVPAAGTVRVVDGNGATLLEQSVEAGDVFRACQTKDAPIKDWVQLAVRRARATGAPAVFWLDETRAHDAEVLKKVRTYLAEEDTSGLTIEVKDVAEATAYTSMVSPLVSCSPSWARTFLSTSPSCPRVSSSQNTAGEPVARARETASSTQLRMGASLVWQARQMSPGSTSWESSTVPSAASTTRTVPAVAISTSCRGCRTPRPSAPSGRRSAWCPWWRGRRRRARGRSSTVSS